MKISPSPVKNDVTVTDFRRLLQFPVWRTYEGIIIILVSFSIYVLVMSCFLVIVRVSFVLVMLSFVFLLGLFCYRGR